VGFHILLLSDLYFIIAVWTLCDAIAGSPFISGNVFFVYNNWGCAIIAPGIMLHHLDRCSVSIHAVRTFSCRVGNSNVRPVVLVSHSRWCAINEGSVAHCNQFHSSRKYVIFIRVDCWHGWIGMDLWLLFWSFACSHKSSIGSQWHPIHRCELNGFLNSSKQVHVQFFYSGFFLRF
jgi:hypothetical protein